MRQTTTVHRWPDRSPCRRRGCGAEHAGVDILPCDDGGYSVIEVNTIPGWRALAAATGVDAAQSLVDHVLEEVGWSG